MGKAADFLAKLKKIKHIEIIGCGILIAVVLAIYFSCTSHTTYDEPDLSGADYCTAMQAKLERVISQIAGVGSASVAINWDKSAPTSSFGSGSAENPKATGVLVVCEGGNDTKVKLDVIYAVSTLLDLPIDKIIVYPKSN